MQLAPHQIKIVENLADKAGLFLSMRVGKTPTAIRLACARAHNTLIVVPKSLKNQWLSEVDIWKNSETNFYIISKDDLRLNKNIPQKIDSIIVDEAHLAFANYQSKTFKSLESLIKKHDVKFIWLLTGTPQTSNYWAAYSYGKLLGKNWNWFEWKKFFFYDIKFCRCKTACKHRKIPKPRTDREPQLLEIYRKIGVFLSLKDISEVVDDVDIIEEFPLNEAQKQLIKEAWDPLPIVRYGAQHQLESGVKKGDGYTEGLNFPIDKDKRLVELVDSIDKVVIVCRYLDQIEKYKQLFANIIGKEIFTISGQIKEEAGDVAKKAEQSQAAIVLVQGDTAAGYSLKSFNTMIFASMSYSFTNYEQMKARIKAKDKNIACEYIHLLTEVDSIDMAVYMSVRKKQDFNIELYKNYV